MIIFEKIFYFRAQMLIYFPAMTKSQHQELLQAYDDSFNPDKNKYEDTLTKRFGKGYQELVKLKLICDDNENGEEFPGRHVLDCWKLEFEQAYFLYYFLSIRKKKDKLQPEFLMILILMVSNYFI